VFDLVYCALQGTAGLGTVGPGSVERGWVGRGEVWRGEAGQGSIRHGATQKAVEGCPSTAFICILIVHVNSEQLLATALLAFLYYFFNRLK
jgi:hypothetical protein